VSPDSEAADIGARVRAARVRQGLSREELAVRTGLSWSAIAQIETGRRTNLRPSTLGALARSLAVTVDHLVAHQRPTGLLKHRALVYESDEEFVETSSAYLRTAVANAEPALAVITRSKAKLLREALGADGRRVTFADSSKWYRDPVRALTAYRRFADEGLAKRASWMCVLGEPVWSGRSEDDVRFWTRYEALVNLAFADLPLTLVCPYDAQALDPAIVENACTTHCEFLRKDGVEQNPSYVDPSEFILQP
jgi:transcriptional regulator with XRE-family HTH domain